MSLDEELDELLNTRPHPNSDAQDNSEVDASLVRRLRFTTSNRATSPPSGGSIGVGQSLSAKITLGERYKTVVLMAIDAAMMEASSPSPFPKSHHLSRSGGTPLRTMKQL